MRFKGRAAACAAVLGLAGLGGAGEVMADEVFVGAFAHDVTFIGDAIGLGAAGREHGVDLHIGYRSDPIEALRFIWRPQAHAYVSINSHDTSHYAAAGLSWRIPLGERVYFRPGGGLAYTTGLTGHPPANVPGLTLEERARREHLYYNRIDFGSKVLFEAQLALGFDLTERLSLEAAYTHLSHGQIFHRGKNQGLDDAGVRLIWKLGPS